MNDFSIEQRDEQLYGSQASITYHLHFHRASQHLVDIQMDITNAPPNPELYLPVWVPGSYKIREFSTHIGDLRAETADGQSLSIEWLTKNRFRILCDRSTDLRLSYCVFAHERSVRTSFVNRWYAFLMPATFCFAVAGRESSVHHIVLHPPKQWQGIATALSPVTQKDSIVGALNYDILVDSPIQLSESPVHHFSAAGIRHDLSIIGQCPFSLPWLIDKLQRIVEVEAQLFGGDLPYDRYVFMLHFFPNSRGGLEHARSSVSGWDPTALTTAEEIQQFLILLAHEFFHVWNGKRIRPVELGPFNYHQENYCSMLWLTEGLTSYYNDLFLYRCGFATEQEFLTLLARDRIQRFFQEPGAKKMSVADSSFLAWVKLYRASADAPNRFPSYYRKGALIFLLLDLWIIIHTNATASLDTVVQALWQRYKDNPHRGMTEEEFITIAEQSTGLSLSSLLHSWIHSVDPLPLEEIFAHIGFHLERQPLTETTVTFGTETLSFPPAEAWTGCSFKETAQGVTIATVIEGSPASDAGIGVDDILVTINGTKINTIAQANALLAAHINTPLSLTLLCDGRLYSTKLTPKATYQYTLKPFPSIGEETKRLQRYWLQRPQRS